MANPNMLQPHRALLAAAALAMAGPASTGDLPYHGDGHVMVTPDALDWGNIASMAPPA